MFHLPASLEMVQIEFTDRVIPSDVVQFEPNEYATKENILRTKKMSHSQELCLLEK